jgi:hypothetical protein
VLREDIRLWSKGDSLNAREGSATLRRRASHLRGGVALFVSSGSTDLKGGGGGGTWPFCRTGGRAENGEKLPRKK